MAAAPSLPTLMARNAIELPPLRRLDAKTIVQRFPRLPHGQPFGGNFAEDHFKGPEERLFLLPLSTPRPQDDVESEPLAEVAGPEVMEDSSAVMWVNEAAVKRRAEYLSQEGTRKHIRIALKVAALLWPEEGMRA